MRTDCLPADPETLARGAALLRGGEVVGFPTETVYGLGADALHPSAVRKIFAAKERPVDNPLIVHVAEADAVEPLVRCIDPRARALMAAFWPGPLTLVMDKSDRIPDEVSAGLHTVGVRMPAHPVAQALIRAAGVPVAAPSANRSGRPSPTTAQHVLEDMEGRIPLIVDGGACRVGLESTVLDITRSVPVILRPGGVTPEMLRPMLGEVLVDESALSPLSEEGVPRSPGMKYTHYAPKAEVILYAGEPEARWAALRQAYDAADSRGVRAVILSPQEHRGQYKARRFYALGSLAAPDAAAAELFAALRALDAQGAQLILAETLDTAGIGLAVMNRLCRAAGFHIEYAE